MTVTGETAFRKTCHMVSQDVPHGLANPATSITETSLEPSSETPSFQTDSATRKATSRCPLEDVEIKKDENPEQVMGSYGGRAR